MAKKRGHGEGTIYRQPNGRWRAMVTIGTDPQTNKPIRRSISGPTRQAVAAKMNEIINQVNAGTYVIEDKMTLGQWLDIWLETYSRPAVRPTTYDSYNYLIRNHIKPCLGHILLRRLQPFHIQEFYNKKLSEKRLPKTMPKDPKKAEELREKAPTLSPSTVKHMHVVLKQALTQAMKERRLTVNPVLAIKAPKLKKKEAVFLNGEEIGEFLDRATGSRWFSFFLCAAGTGARLGELTALRWNDVDLEGGFITIRQAIHRVASNDPDGPKTKLITQPPKSEKGRRKIPLPGDVTAELKRLKKRQAAEKLLMANKYFNDGPQEEWYVFTWEDGRPVDPSYLSKQFKKIMRGMGREDVTFHALRHSFASALLRAGEHPRTVQELLGDSTVQVVLDTYSHVEMDLMEKAAEKIDSILKTRKRKGERRL